MKKTILSTLFLVSVALSQTRVYANYNVFAENDGGMIAAVAEKSYITNWFAFK